MRVGGITGLIAAAVGGYLMTFDAWQVSSRLLAEEADARPTTGHDRRL
jgi:hypothetical protein